MDSASKDGVSPRMYLKLMLVVLFLSSSGAAVVPGLLSSGATSAAPLVSPGGFDLLLQANGEVVIYRRDYSTMGLGTAGNPMRWRAP
jgi:hypothetical protein